jgi:hypothetical protein
MNRMLRRMTSERGITLMIEMMMSERRRETKGGGEGKSGLILGGIAGMGI